MREKRQACEKNVYFYIQKWNKKWRQQILQKAKSARDISLKWGTLKVEVMVIESLNSSKQKVKQIKSLIFWSTERDRVYETNKSHMLKQTPNRAEKIVLKPWFPSHTKKRLHVFSRQLNFKSHNSKLSSLYKFRSKNVLLFTWIGLICPLHKHTLAISSSRNCSITRKRIKTKTKLIKLKKNKLYSNKYYI